MQQEKIYVTHLDPSIDEMVTVIVYGREQALQYAKGKQYVSIILQNNLSLKQEPNE